MNETILTPRERQVLGLIAEGLTQAQIGQTLHIRMPTVKTHVERLLPKIGASNAPNAVAIVLRSRIIT